MVNIDGGDRYCPLCKKVVETIALPKGYSQTTFRAIRAKRRHIICGTDEKGSNGCGTQWYTLEIEENALNAL